MRKRCLKHFIYEIKIYYIFVLINIRQRQFFDKSLCFKFLKTCIKNYI